MTTSYINYEKHYNNYELMRDITAEELHALANFYYQMGDIEKSRQYTREFDELQNYYNRD